MGSVYSLQEGERGVKVSGLWFLMLHLERQFPNFLYFSLVSFYVLKENEMFINSN